MPVGPDVAVHAREGVLDLEPAADAGLEQRPQAVATRTQVGDVRRGPVAGEADVALDDRRCVAEQTAAGRRPMVTRIRSVPARYDPVGPARRPRDPARPPP